MEFVFAPNAASFGFYNPQTWASQVGSLSFVPPIISYQWVGVGFDWPYVNSQVGLEANTQYLVHCGFSWSVTAGAISEVGVEVISGTAPTLGGAFTFDSVGAVAYDRGGTGFSTEPLPQPDRSCQVQATRQQVFRFVLPEWSRPLSVLMTFICHSRS